VQSIRNELLEALEAAIRKLPDEYRPVFILRDVDGLTSREVGKLLDLSVPAVKSRLHRSRLMVRRRLQKFFPEPQRHQPEQALAPQDGACELGMVNSSGD
jgi:DNA-directed RNA polymerase specialized sigma24 family protein